MESKEPFDSAWRHGAGSFAQGLLRAASAAEPGVFFPFRPDRTVRRARVGTAFDADAARIFSRRQLEVRYLTLQQPLISISVVVRCAVKLAKSVAD